MNPWVLTILGSYDPSIVNRVASVVAQHDANWNESRLVSLAGRFAGVVKVTVAEEREAELLAALEGIEGLRILTERGDAGEEASSLQQIEVTCTDRPGIVRDVTAAIAAHDGRVERFRTEYRSAPWGGGVLFYARLRVRVPALEPLRDALMGLADDLIVDVKDVST